MKLSKLFFYSLIFSLPLGQIGRLPIGSEGVNIYLHDLIVIILVFYWLIYSLSVKKSIKIPKYYLYVLFFSAIAVISLINGKRWINWGEWFISSFYLTRWVIYSFLALITIDLEKRFKNSQKIVKYLMFSGVILSLIGFVQLLFLPDLSALDSKLGWDPHINRLFSSFFDPNFTGAYIVMSLTLAISKLLYTKRSDSSNILISILLISLLLTFSRSAWLMFAIVIGVLGVLKSRWLLAFALITAFSAYYFVPRVQTRITGTTDPADSAHFRLISWKNTYKIAEDNLLLGVGFNTFRYAQDRYGLFEDLDNPLGGRAGAGSDSSLLLALATTGIFGLIMYLSFFLVVLRDSVNDFLNGKNLVSLGLLAIIFGLLVESQFINSLFYPQIMIFLWILIGLKYSNVK